MSSIQRWSNRSDRRNGLAVVITLKGLVCFRLKWISSAILDFFRQHFGFLYGLVVSKNLGAIFLKKCSSPDKIRIWTQNYFFDILAMAGATDGILKLKYAWCFPLSKAVFIVWIRRPSPEKIENEKSSYLYLRQTL